MNKINLSSDSVKIIALVSMTLDHMSKIFGTFEWVTGSVGRIAFPVFAYLIVHNFYLYHPIRKYLFRLGLFTILTHFLLLPWQNGNNVLSTFFWGILFLSAAEYVCEKTKSFFWQFYWLGVLFLIIQPFILMADYSLLGFLLLIALYAWNRFPNKVNYIAVLAAGTICNFNGVIPVIVTLLTLISLMSFIRVLEGQRVIKWWGFYFYYPLHQMLFYSLKTLSWI